MSQQLIDRLNAHPNIDKAAMSKHYRLGLEDGMAGIRARVRRDEWDEDCIVIVDVDDILLGEHDAILKMVLTEADRAGAERYA